MSKHVGLLISGELGFYCLRSIEKEITPQFIFTNRDSVEIIDYAHKNDIPIFIGNPRKKDSADFIKKFDTDIIFSINYLFIVDQIILDHPKFYAINFHGSLLPKYRGRTPHVWAIINGEVKTGITAHVMESGCDTGDIVLKKEIEIGLESTGNDILEVFKKSYPGMIIKVYELIKQNKLIRIKQDVKKATYFGKRTPEDGKINWNWQKERINNWVRAQAYPYPGAFGFLNNKKVIIDKIRYTDIGFENDMPNGLVVSTLPDVLVKTPNGVIELQVVRNRIELDFHLNDQLK